MAELDDACQEAQSDRMTFLCSFFELQDHDAATLADTSLHRFAINT